MRRITVMPWPGEHTDAAHPTTRGLAGDDKYYNGAVTRRVQWLCLIYNKRASRKWEYYDGAATKRAQWCCLIHDKRATRWPKQTQ